MSCENTAHVVVLVYGLMPFAVYLCVRFGAAAFFRSKRDHDLHQLKKD